MKKTYTLIVATMLAAGSAFAQGAFGTISLNNYDSGKGIFLGNLNTPAPAGTIVDVLSGASASSLTPVLSTGPGNPNRYVITAGDINANGAGTGSFFDYGTGITTGIAPSTSGTIVVRAWTGAATYDAATIRGSLQFTQTVGTNPAAPNLPSPAVLAMPSTLIMVPEPSAIVLGILGAGALLLRRRK